MKTEKNGHSKKFKLPKLESEGWGKELDLYLDKIWEFLNKTETKRRLLGIGTTIVLCLLFLSSLYGERLDLNPGDVVKKDIIAPREIVDYTTWEDLQREVERKVSKDASENEENYKVEKTYLYSAEEDYTEIIKKIIENRTEDTAKPKDIGMLQSLISEETKLDISAATLKTLMQLEEETLLLLKTMGLEAISAVMNTGLSTQTLPKAREKVAQMFLSSDVDIEFESLTAASEVVQLVLRPNLILDSQKVRQIVDKAIETARLDAPKIKKGQVIIREGDVLTEKDTLILEDLNLLKKSWNWQKAIGIVALTIATVSVIYYYIYLFYRNLENKYLTLFSTIALIVAFLGKLLSLIEWPYALYFFPASAATMLVTILINPVLGVFSSFAFAMITGFFTNFAVAPTLMSLFGAIVGVYSVSEATQRGTLMQAGFVVGLSNALAMIATGLVLDEHNLILMCFIGLINGVASAVLTIGILPFLEAIFSVTSPMRLLELSNPNNPLLRRLSLEAPGTYHHSIVVGNLAEAAAEAIGADSLLTRVGALYHDVGKIARPYFFAENQRGGENPHDKMNPSLSKMVILNHVKEGMELAKEYKLPNVIKDFITEHHGTSMVQYFYQKAKEIDQNPILPDDFSYTGPKPQSKETAILMLADSAEAAVRSLSQPTFDKIQSMIRNIVKVKLDSGQLSESTLTLKEIDIITEVLSNVAAGVHHTRVKYPGQKM